MRGSRTLRLAASLLVLLGSLYFVPRAGNVAASGVANGTPSASPTRLLVVVPHPDDAALVAAGLIEQTRARGGLVKVAVMTNGDGFRLAASKALRVAHPGPHDLFRLGLLRQREELAADKELGVAERDVTFLGYPDGGLQHLFQAAHWTANAPFRGMNGATHVPYPLSFRNGAPYCGQAVVDDLRQLIRSFQPTDVLFPDAHDIHNDHWATNAFLQYVLGTMQQAPRAHTYLVHYPGFPVPRHYAPERPLEPPHALTEADSNTQWHRLQLTAEQIAAKKKAIHAHRSQMLVMSDLLLSFVRTNDLVADAKTQVLAESPAGGKNPFLHTNTTGNLPFVVDRDPQEKQTNRPGGDLESLRAVRSGDRLHVCVETSDVVSQDLTYRVHLRWLGVPPTMREPSDLVVRSGKIWDSQNRFHPPRSQQPTVLIRHNRLLLTIPSAAIRHAQAFMISTEAMEHEHILDKTDWQTLRIHQSGSLTP